MVATAVIVGAGSTGFAIAKALRQDNYDVCIIESNPDFIHRVEEQIDVKVLRGKGTSQSLLKEAGVARADYFIATLDNTEENILASMLAHRMGAKVKIAVVRDLEFVKEDSYLKLTDLGIDFVINPEQLIINYILQIIKVKGAVNYDYLKDLEIVLYDVKITDEDPFVHRTVGEIKKDIEEEIKKANSHLEPFKISMISRAGKLMYPRNEEKLFPGDIIHFLIPYDILQKFLNFAREELTPLRYMVIAGADTIGVEVAKGAEKQRMNVALIENDTFKAEAAASMLSKAVVLQGSPTEIDILTQEDIPQSDLFFAATEDEKINLVACMLARNLGIKKIITLTTSPEYAKVAKSMKIDIVIDPNIIVTNKILQFIKKPALVNISRFQDADIALLSFTVMPESIFVGKRVNEIKFPEDSCPGAIIRNHKILSPAPDEFFKADDHIIVFTRPSNIAYFEKLLSGKR